MVGRSAVEAFGFKMDKNQPLAEKEGRRKAACMINAAVLSEQRLMEVPE